MAVVVPDRFGFLRAVNNGRNEDVKKLISYVVDKTDLQVGLSRLLQVPKEQWKNHFAAEADKNFLQLRFVLKFYCFN
jgi:hypothetical protein